MRYIVASALALTVVTSLGWAETVKPMNVMFEDGTVGNSLTGEPGDAENGRKVFMNRKLGNCLACHTNTDLDDQPFHGEVGPPLDGVADRWEEAEMRAIVANSKMVFPDTIMPAFYIDSGYTRALEKFEGKSILNAQQVEDIVAYLMTLKEE